MPAGWFNRFFLYLRGWKQLWIFSRPLFRTVYNVIAQNTIYFACAQTKAKPRNILRTPNAKQTLQTKTTARAHWEKCTKFGGKDSQGCCLPHCTERDWESDYYAALLSNVLNMTTDYSLTVVAWPRVYVYMCMCVAMILGDREGLHEVESVMDRAHAAESE